MYIYYGIVNINFNFNEKNNFKLEKFMCNGKEKH